MGDRRPRPSATSAGARTARGERRPRAGLPAAPGPPGDDGGDGARAPAPAGARSIARRAAQAERRRRRTVAVLAVVLALAVPFLAVGGWFTYELDPPGGPGDAVAVRIEKGWGVSDIGDELQTRGVIGSSAAFQLYAKVTGAGPFQDGRYQLPTSLGVRDAVDRLEAGPAPGATDIRLTLRPGLTIDQIATQVGELPGRDKATFLAAAGSGAVRSRYQPPGQASLEGLLFPDTYAIGKKEGETAILRRLVEQFDLEADELGLSSEAAVTGRTPYEALVIASLIETEAGVPEDRPLISAVIHNRMRQGMLLQIDPTVIYAKGPGADRTITSSDLQIESPYNTYRVPGLPPTPIASVTAESLRAALVPASEPFLYFVLADDRGRHAFAVTQAEHEQNVAQAERKGLLD